jgi:surface protein
MLLRVTEGREAFGPLAIRINTELGEDNPHDFDCLSVAAKPGVVVLVNWGDGSDLETYVSTSEDPVLLSHYYDNPGEYLVRVIGDLLSVDTLTPSGSRAAITDILSFGESLASARFEDCVNLAYIRALILPTNITRLCFAGCINLLGVSCERWDTSGITDMSYMFAMPPSGGASAFELAAGGWNTSNVTDMSFMFRGCGAVFAPGGNRGTGGWDTSNVTNMEGMFQRAITDGLDFLGIAKWDTSRVTDMSYMFQRCQLALARTPDLSAWDTSNVADMSFMFEFCVWLEDADLTGWDTTNVTDMQLMFSQSRFSGDVSTWQVGNVRNMTRMFNSSQFAGDVSDWDTRNVTDMNFMFTTCLNFNSPIGGWEVGNVTNMQSMFSACRSFDQPIGGWDVSNVTNMSNMLFNARSFNQPLNNWDVRKVTDLSGFLNISLSGAAFNQPLDKWDIDSVTAATNFLFGAAALSTANWDSLLVAWNSRKANYVTNLNIRSSTRTSTAGGGAAAKTALRAYGWTITDAGNI